MVHAQGSGTYFGRHVWQRFFKHGVLRGVFGSHGSLEWRSARAFTLLDGRSSGSGNDARETHSEVTRREKKTLPFPQQF